MSLRTLLRVVAATLPLAVVPDWAAAQMPASPPEPTAKADAQMGTVLAALAKLGPKPLEALSAADARRQPSAADAVLQVRQDNGEAGPQPMPPVGRVTSDTVPGPGGIRVPVRVYTPPGDGPFPAVVYFHGGGWVVATLDTYDPSCRALCKMVGAVVVSVDYRRAPENKFPAAPEDCYAATQHVIANPAAFGVDPARVAVVGESAGGNLATVVCLMAKERGGRMPIHQSLVYPITNYGFDTPSYQANANAKPLSKPAMRWFFANYLTSPADGGNKLVSPMRASDADLKGLPPATVVTAEIDPLMSDGQLYADKLKAAGVDVSYRHFTGVTHEFFGMAGVVDKAKDAEQFVADRLAASFKAGK
ncbi:MAG: nlhH [Phycisphaerales bacterium]|nr:nlhH [Phycisphaerales bacterium]